MPAVVDEELYAEGAGTNLDESAVLLSRGTLLKGKPHEC
jgi:hypothetical protein